MLRRIISFVYILSGLLKLMDPVGIGLIVEAYFRFMHLNNFIEQAKSFGAMLGFAETAIGLVVFFCIWQKVSRWLLVAMQSFFTVISLVLLIQNPEMHCGCFGEAIHLTHLQTFIKNIILMGMVLYVYFSDRVNSKIILWKYYAFGGLIVLVAAFAQYSWFNLPFIDFTDYDKGTKLLSQAEYRTLSDSVKVDCMPLPMLSLDYKQIPNFSNGEWAIISIYEPIDCQKLADIYTELINTGWQVIVLQTTEMSKKDILNEKFTRKILISDRTTILSLNRLNGGVTFLSNGVIINKTRL